MNRSEYERLLRLRGEMNKQVYQRRLDEWREKKLSSFRGRRCPEARDILIKAGVAARLLDYINRYGGPPGANPTLENSDFYAVQESSPEREGEVPKTYAVVVFPTDNGRTHELVEAKPGKEFPTSIDEVLTEDEFAAISRAAQVNKEVKKGNRAAETRRRNAT